jgi:hypothetical protein
MRYDIPYIIPHSLLMGCDKNKKVDCVAIKEDYILASSDQVNHIGNIKEKEYHSFNSGYDVFRT